MLEKISKWFMSADNKTMFDTYITYFPTIGKSMRKLRGTRVRVTTLATGEVEEYNSWTELDAVYKQVNKDDAPIVQELPKIWTYGHAARYNEISKHFKKIYGEVASVGTYNKPTWVYYVDSNGCLCSTSNDMVIDLLKNSKEWTKYELPPLKKYTKAQIAELLGMDVNEFEIVG